jgi:hypothetical protein
MYFKKPFHFVFEWDFVAVVVVVVVVVVILYLLLWQATLLL